MKRIVVLLYGFLLIGLTLSAVYLPDILSPKAQTLDFRGYVEEMNYDADQDLFFINASYINSDAQAEITASPKISCRYLDGRAFPISSLKKGDMIDLDYKGRWGLEDNGVMRAEAKWITVCPIN